MAAATGLKHVVLWCRNCDRVWEDHVVDAGDFSLYYTKRCKCGSYSQREFTNNKKNKRRIKIMKLNNGDSI